MPRKYRTLHRGLVAPYATLVPDTASPLDSRAHLTVVALRPLSVVVADLAYAPSVPHTPPIGRVAR
eukprot:758524-Rhodomonas_salina.1